MSYDGIQLLAMLVNDKITPDTYDCLADDDLTLINIDIEPITEPNE